jgi:hypothetical protein
MRLSIQTGRLVTLMILFWMGGCGRSDSITPKDLPQSQVDPAFYKSFYSGQAISDPESLSGTWQMDDGQGGAVGIELTLTTSLSDSVRTSKGGPEAWQALQVGVFHRSSSTIRLGDENFFSDSPQGGNVRYENGRLVLHIGWADLDLERSTEDGWSGRLHRKDFDQQVVLTRGNKSLEKVSLFVGTWRRQVEEARFSCLHIVKTGADAFSGWEDLHAIPGLLRYAPYLKRPPSVIQTYGNAILVSSQGSTVLRLDSPKSLGGCCPFSSLARLNRDVMEVQSFDGGVPRGPWDGRNWRKMPGPSCVSIPRRQ